METVNALQLRQSLGKVLQRLKRSGKPILVEKNREPSAVLISIEDYRRRFVDHDADETRLQIVSRIKQANLQLPGTNALDTLKALRREP